MAISNSIIYLCFFYRTGEILGFAHPLCNRERQCSRQIPVLFHNLRGYDGHLLIKALARRVKDTSSIRVIPKNMESYTAILTDDFRFIG